MKVVITWDKKCDCWRLTGHGFHKGFDTIVEVDAALWAIRLMMPDPVALEIVDKTPSKNFHWLTVKHAS